MAVSIKRSTVNNIFKATILIATQKIVEYYLEYRRKNIQNPAIFKTIINTKLVLLENAIVYF